MDIGDMSRGWLIVYKSITAFLISINVNLSEVKLKTC